MSESAGSDAGGRRRRHRSRRGLFARLGRWFGLGGEVRDAAVALLRAEARLARAALPQLLLWIAVVSIGGVLFLATLWGAALMLLYDWTGSIGQALLWLGAVSLVVLAVALVFLRRMLRAASFAESRRRIVFWLERSEPDDGAEQTAE
jgi:hypothetical protein